MRYGLNSFPYHSITMCPMMGFYDEDDKGQFLSAADFMNLTFDSDRHQISFHVFSEELRSKIVLVTDFTIAPLIVCARSTNLDRNIAAEDVDDAETVKAPFYKRMPLVFECKMRLHDGFRYEADVMKVSASEMILDAEGNVDLSMMLSEMMLILD